MLRTRVYVDGYNLYYGCLKGSAYRWLDLHKLFRDCILPSAQLQGLEAKLLSSPAIQFFTAPILARAAKSAQSVGTQLTYHSALQHHDVGAVNVVLGYFSMTPVRAKRIDLSNKKVSLVSLPDVDVWKLEEKKTDVHLALQAYHDAITHEVDHVVIVSNDTDIAPALEMIRRHTKAYIGLVVPSLGNQTHAPTRWVNQELRDLAHWTRSHILPSELAESQLPYVVLAANGKAFSKPDSWFTHPSIFAEALRLGVSQWGSRSAFFQRIKIENPHFAGKTLLGMLESSNTLDAEAALALIQNWKAS
jgi:6-hydroxy-3-succinoylpyridine 3-monooxygenase